MPRIPLETLSLRLVFVRISELSFAMLTSFTVENPFSGFSSNYQKNYAGSYKFHLAKIVSFTLNLFLTVAFS